MDSAAKQRCSWATKTDIERDYHDNEWGTPVHDDRLLFEFLILEGAQAGLSWHTILQKREGYRRAFDNFDASKIAQYDDAKLAKLAQDTGIVRNKLKIKSAVTNAQAYRQVVQEHGSFAAFMWSFVGGAPIINRWQRAQDVPVSTPESDAMAKALKQAGFKFCGTTICYAYMQATGMVNDHTTDCWRYRECGG